MSPLQVAAQFAAYLDYLHAPENEGKSRDEAHRFARANWPRFLGAADEGTGRLLMVMAGGDGPDGGEPAPRPRRGRAAALAATA